MRRLPVLILLCLTLTACAPRLSVFGDFKDPLAETTLSGEGEAKLALIQLRGVISAQPKDGLISSSQSPVHEVLKRLALAREDEAVKAVVLAVDSPGGTIGGSELIEHALASFREETGKPIVAFFVNIAASGGYYVSARRDGIVAMPGAITGSIGTIFLIPKVHDLFATLGVGVEVTASGRNKDMLSPFRPSTEEEKQIVQEMIDGYNARFLEIVTEGRGELTPQALETIATARILTAEQALELGLVDKLGYMEDAVAMAAELAGVEDPRLVVYRERSLPNDTPYGAEVSLGGGALPGAELTRFLAAPRTGFYFLWAPEYAAR